MQGDQEGGLHGEDGDAGVMERSHRSDGSFMTAEY
jgi:hypothetical protein